MRRNDFQDKPAELSPERGGFSHHTELAFGTRFRQSEGATKFSQGDCESRNSSHREDSQNRLLPFRPGSSHPGLARIAWFRYLAAKLSCPCLLLIAPKLRRPSNRRHTISIRIPSVSVIAGPPDRSRSFPVRSPKLSVSILCHPWLRLARIERLTNHCDRWGRVYWLAPC